MPTPPRNRRSRPVRVGVLICCVSVCFWVLQGCSTEPNHDPERVPSAARPINPTGQVWAHYVPQGLPEQSEAAGSGPYGSNFPLDLQPPGTSGDGAVAANLARVRAAGFTGIQVLQIEGVNGGADFVEGWMQEVRRESEQTPFMVAPCLLPKTTAGTVQLIEQYVALAREYPSAAKVEGAFVVYVYSARNLSVEQWSQVRAGLEERKLPVYLIGDLQTEASQHGDTLNKGLVRPYVDSFDALWLFDDRADQIWAEFLSFARAEDKTFVGGVMPGYNRETPLGGYLDAEGTATFRRQWQRNLEAGLPWVNVTTWNDYVESTDVRAGSDWNFTRQDINAFYSAQFRKTNLQFDGPQSYVTTPKSVLSGHPIRAEGLVLNDNSGAVSLHIVIVDRRGNPLAPAIRKEITGVTAQSVNTDIEHEPRVTTGTVVYAEVTLRNQQGKMLQKVRSAPIVVYSAEGAPGETEPSRRTYYSIPARQAMPEPVTLTVTNTGGEGRPVEAVAKTSSPVRFLQTIQNARSIGLGFDAESLTSSTPMERTRIVGGQHVSTSLGGFYLARAIDNRGRVAYSAPQYVESPSS